MFYVSVQHAQKELNAVRDSKDKQIEELRRAIQDNTTTRQTEIEKKVREECITILQERLPSVYHLRKHMGKA